MKIEDLIQLLTNRSREFKLSRDYAKMSGDLDRMNAADKEVIALEDTLYQLNLLVDTTRSAAVKEEILSEVLTDGSVSVLGEYDITVYATDPLHERKIMNILSKMGVMDTVDQIDSYIRNMTFSSPVTGEMVMSAALAYDVDTRLLMAMMQQDSSFGTAGIAVRTRNPGNVGNDDDGNTRTYDSWQEGVTAVAEWLNRHRGSTNIPVEVSEPVVTPTPPIVEPVASTTPAFIDPAPTTATSTPITAPSTSSGQATTTPVTSTATTTPVTASTTPMTTAPTTATSTPVTAPSSSGQATSTPVTTTSTTTTSTTTPVTTSPVVTSPSSGQATSTPVTTTAPVTTTSTTTTATTSAPQVSPLQTTTEETATSTASAN